MISLLLIAGAFTVGYLLRSVDMTRRHLTAPRRYCDQLHDPYDDYTEGLGCDK